MSIKFLAIERKKLVAGVKNEEYKDVMEEAFTQLIHDHQFKYYSARLRFVEVFKAEPMKAKFLRWIKTMKATCRTQSTCRERSCHMARDQVHLSKKSNRMEKCWQQEVQSIV